MVCIFRSKQLPPSSPNEAVGSQSEWNQPIDYKEGRDLKTAPPWKHVPCLYLLLRAFILSSECGKKKKKKKPLQFVYDGEADGAGKERRERERSKYKIKSRPVSCSAHFVVLCDTIQVQDTGLARCHDCRLLISANTARNLLRGKCQMCRRRVRVSINWRQILKNLRSILYWSGWKIHF